MQLGPRDDATKAKTSYRSILKLNVFLLTGFAARRAPQLAVGAREYGRNPLSPSSADELSPGPLLQFAGIGFSQSVSV